MEDKPNVRGTSGAPGLTLDVASNHIRFALTLSAVCDLSEPCLTPLLGHIHGNPTQDYANHMVKPTYLHLAAGGQTHGDDLLGDVAQVEVEPRKDTHK